MGLVGVGVRIRVRVRVRGRVGHLIAAFEVRVVRCGKDGEKAFPGSHLAERTER